MFGIPHAHETFSTPILFSGICVFLAEVVDDIYLYSGVCMTARTPCYMWIFSQTSHRL